tara:strand:- start:3440 stop:3742 length:303 start_codon:yes stop_codon:yes gene_type:complete
MPYKFETNNTPLPRSKDRRVKLTNAQRSCILYRKGESKAPLATEFGVSRRLIDFIQNPEKQRENLLRRQERGGTAQYYDKDKHRESMKKYRQDKQQRLEK